MRQFLDVVAVVLGVELLEYCDETRDVVWAVDGIDLRLSKLVLPHYRTQGLIVAQVLEQADGEHGEETGHRFERQCDRINLIHRVYMANTFRADGELLQHVVEGLLRHVLSLLLCQRRLVRSEHLIWHG